MVAASWTSLEITKLVVAGLTPVLVAALGFWLNRRLKSLEQAQWAQQKVIDRRIKAYDELAKPLNELFCFFCYVGSWKEITPPDLVRLKRELDQTASLVDWTGNVPAQYMAAFFRARKPTSDVVAYANLWENLWSDDYVRTHQAMARWARTHVDFPGAAFRQVHDQWFRDNAFLHGRLRLGGRPVELERVRCPTLSILALRDDLVVPEAANPIAGLLGAGDFELLELEAGHAGLSASRTATRRTFPALIDWLQRHSDPRSTTP